MAEFLEGIKGYSEVDVTEIGSKPKEIVPGGYVLRIANAKTEHRDANTVIIKLMFDIEEGEYKGYYKALYDYNKSGQYAEQAKWKGILNIWYPVDNGDPERFKKDVANFKRTITAINDSNPGKKAINPESKFSTDDFKGKLVGGAFGLVDWEYNGKSGTRCECRWFVGIDHIKAGDFQIPNHKPMKGKEPMSQTETAPATTNPAPAQSISNDFEEILSDGDIPF